MFDAVSMATSQTSAATNVQNLDSASIFVEWSGASSPVGTVTVQARNGAAGTWYTLDFGASIDVSGASGNHQLVFNEMPFTDIRLVYTRSSGSGPLTATISAKTVGA